MQVTVAKTAGFCFGVNRAVETVINLLDEGKKVYLINYTDESTGLYDKLGFEVSCEIGKLYLTD